MNRRERRRRARFEKKLRKRLAGHTASGSANLNTIIQPPTRKQFFGKTIPRTKVIWAVVLGSLTLLSGYLSFHPQVSVEPGVVLNHGDPFSTQFNVTNQNQVFAVRDLQTSCRTIYVITNHDFGMSGLPPRPSPTVPVLRPGEEATVTCLPIVEGLGAGAGNVEAAYIEIDLGYEQDGWPFDTRERFPLRGVVDDQNGVHWTHITPEQLEADLGRKPVR